MPIRKWRRRSRPCAGKGKLTAILSNGSPSMLDAAVRHAGLDKLFNMVLSVEDVGIYKPSRRVYRHAMQKLQLHDAPSICFVSANTWDAQAAAQFGFPGGAGRPLRPWGRPHPGEARRPHRRSQRAGGARLDCRPCSVPMADAA